MSVYTKVEPDQLARFLARYDIGEALALIPIAAGITNTNYRLDTNGGHFVLTLYEHHGDDELDYMLGLQQHLAARAVRCPAPLRDRRGELYSSLNRRPAAIIERLPGAIQTEPGPGHCAAIGAELASFHLAGLDFEGSRPNPRGIDWLTAAGDRLAAKFDDYGRQLFAATLLEYRTLDVSALPRGAIHADLFHDNALFVGDELSGVIDFDFACYDSLVFDIAVLLNDWCIDARGGLCEPLVKEVLDAYQRHRCLTREEIDALPMMLRLGALRFWISRFHDMVFPLSGELTFIKNPDVFRDMLTMRGSEATRLERLFLRYYTG